MKRIDFEAFPPAIFIGSIFFALVLAVASNVIKDYYIPAQLLDLDLETETETGSMLTETGSTLEEDRQLTPEERTKRINGFIIRIETRSEKIKSQQMAQQLRRQEAIEYQLECKDDVRSSNRDTKLSTMFRCYRGILTLNLETLRKERTNLDDITGATPEIIEESLGTINALMDAIATVIDAIDAGVYGSEEDLREAKLNLAEKYWTPKWLSSTRLRADNMLTWTSLLMNEASAIIVRDDLLLGESEIYTNAYSCLEDAELRLVAVLDATDLDTASQKMEDSINGLMQCKVIFTSDPIPVEENEPVDLKSEPETEELEPILPKKSLRRSRY
ncbi:MAG: hypothetical protein K9M03_02760 [Kiritimatiellales bacterium]|nr:hypothetical protein [Kiritimatiellales bacterium]